MRGTPNTPVLHARTTSSVRSEGRGEVESTASADGRRVFRASVYRSPGPPRAPGWREGWLACLSVRWRLQEHGRERGVQPRGVRRLVPAELLGDLLVGRRTAE